MQTSRRRNVDAGAFLARAHFNAIEAGAIERKQRIPTAPDALKELCACMGINPSGKAMFDVVQYLRSAPNPPQWLAVAVKGRFIRRPLEAAA